MPALATIVTTTTAPALQLRPTVRAKLLTELRAYAKLKSDLDAIELKMDAKKKVIGGMRDDTGEASIELEGFKVTLVAGVRSKLDPEKLIAQGVTTAQIEAATVTTPIKAYDKITCP